MIVLSQCVGERIVKIRQELTKLMNYLMYYFLQHRVHRPPVVLLQYVVRSRPVSLIPKTLFCLNIIVTRAAGVWRDVLWLVEEYAEKHEQLHIITGPVFDYNSDGHADSLADIRR